MKIKKRIILVFIVIALLIVTSCEAVDKAYKETFRKNSDDEIVDNGSYVEVYFEVREKLRTKISDRELDYILDIVENSKDYGQYLDDDILELLVLEAQEEVRKNSLFAQRDTLKEAKEKLKTMFPGEELMVYGPVVHFQYKSIGISLIDPIKPENVDYYYFNLEEGKWTKEEPVKISNETDLSENSIPLEVIDFEIVAKLFDIAEEKSIDIEGAEPVNHIYFNFFKNGDNYFWATINGDRGDYHLKLDLNGDVIEFERR